MDDKKVKNITKTMLFTAMLMFAYKLGKKAGMEHSIKMFAAEFVNVLEEKSSQN